MTASDIGFERLNSARSDTAESQRSTQVERSEGAPKSARRGAADDMDALSAAGRPVFTPVKWRSAQPEVARSPAPEPPRLRTRPSVPQGSASFRLLQASSGIAPQTGAGSPR